MDVKVHLLGILPQYFQTSSLNLNLAGTPTLADLCLEIGRRFGKNLPPHLWDAERNAFAIPVFIRGKGRDLSAPAEALEEGEEIYILLPQAGG